MGTTFTPAEARTLIKPLAAALDYAHDQGIVHGDLKPENIMLTALGPVITDFGLARLWHEQRPAARAVLGTPAYMSPEQIEGRVLDRRADVYALGVLLYELLTGRAPFTGADAQAVVAAHLQLPPPILATLNPGLKDMPRLDSVVRRAVAKRVDERWSTAGAVALALTRASRDWLLPGVPRGAHSPGIQWFLSERHGRIVLLLSLLAILLVSLWVAFELARDMTPIASVFLG